MLGRWNTWYDIAGDLIYTLQGAVALWGVYCMIMFMRRIYQLSFRSEGHQEEFLNSVEEGLERRRADEVEAACEADVRALPKLIAQGLHARGLGMARATKMIHTRLQRDVLADFQRRSRWIGHCIKVAPMLGLFGTVLGMMGAFSQLATAENVEPTELANNISLALMTTAIGLATAMPLMFALQKANERLIEFQELTALGLARFLETAKPLFADVSGAAPRPPTPAAARRA